MLEPQGWLTLTALVVMFIALAREWFSPDLTLFMTVLGLWLGGVVTVEEAFAGFSNPQVLAVGMLFIVAAAVKDTGALSSITGALLDKGGSTRGALHRLLWPTAGLSAVMNNTPIVAMLTPEVRAWASARGLPTSRFLMPLSFAAILGGTCTLIGTSTNLLVSGLMEASGLTPLGMFELSFIGLPCTVLGVVYLTTFGVRLLPVRQAPDDGATTNDPEYSVRLAVSAGSALVGQSVEEARLRHLEGLFLTEIERAGRRIVPVRPADRLQAGDQLVLFGVVATVAQLLERPGLVPIDSDDEGAGRASRGEEPAPTGERSTGILYEVVIPANSPLLGQTLRESRFRRRYDAAVVAIHRGGQRLQLKLGEVALKAGDTLLVLASRGFRDTWRDTRDFLLLAARPETLDRSKAPLALLILALMVVALATGVLSTLAAASVAAVALVLTGCVRMGRARSAVDLSVLVLMASSFGLSAAVENSGLAACIGGVALGTLGEGAPLLALAAVYLLCAAVTEALSNAAAAALVFPIAVTVAQQLGMDPRPFAMVVAVAASMSFLTPLGYQTNLLVYGPGGYRFGDFTRAGLPLSFLCFVVTMICVTLFHL